MRWIFFLAGLVLESSVLFGTIHGGPPSLESISPNVGMRGTAFEVIALGSELEHIERVLFYRQGIQCEAIERVDKDRIRLRLLSDHSCPLGMHPIRLVGRYGVSELRLVLISPFPLMMEDGLKEGGRVEDSLHLAGTCSIWGSLSGMEVDDYRIELMAGERFSAEVVGVRLGSKLLDTRLSLVDPDGVELVRSDDSSILGQDPCFSIRVPKAGTYQLSVRSSGGPADSGSTYLLHVGDFPRPTMAFPFGGRAGSDLAVEWIHSPAVAGFDFSSKVLLPNPLGFADVELIDDGVACPTPFVFRVSEFENDPAIAGEEPSLAPVALHGVVQQAEGGPIHRIGVNEPGDYCIEVFASRLGSPLDGVVEIRDQDGNLVAAGDDYESQDPRVILRIDADRELRIRMMDKRRQFGSSYGYRIEIVRWNPEPVAFLPRRDKQSQRMQTVSIPKGNRTLALLGIQRQRSEGSLAVDWNDLPAGVLAETISLSESDFLIPTVLSVHESADHHVALASPIPVVGERRGRFEQVIDLVGGPADSIFQAVSVNRLAVAVVESVPFWIELEPPVESLAIDGTLDLEFTVARAAGFDAPVDVTLAMASEWMDYPAKIRIPKGSDRGILTLSAGSKARPQSWPLILEAGAVGDPRYESVRVCSSLRHLTIAPSPVVGTVNPIAVEAGGAVRVPCQWTPSGPVPDRLVATLEGLPTRIEAAPVDIRSDQLEFAFELRLSDDAPTGRFDGIHVKLAGELQNRQLSYQIARGTSLLVSPPGGLKTDASGRPLTPLEIIRSADPDEVSPLTK